MKKTKLGRIIEILRTFAPFVCVRVVLVLLTRPFLIFPTIRATVETHTITKDKYEEHHHGVGNAYKHALWNMLIMFNCRNQLKIKRLKLWAKQVTDAHENCVVNEEMDRLMDLHNNKIGRVFYETVQSNSFEKEDLLYFLEEKIKTIVELNHPHYFQNYPFDMVVAIKKEEQNFHLN